VWAGITPLNLDGWIANFKNDTERYFGACILDALIFRSEAQTIALMRDIFGRQLPTYFARPTTQGFTLTNLHFYIQDPPPDKVRPIAIVPVIRRDDPPTKSGPLIARMLKRHLNINPYHLLWPWQIQKWRSDYTTNDFIFVDDLLGTGTQFTQFVKEFELDKALQETRCVYCPLVGHDKGVLRLRSLYPNLSVMPVERLSEANNVFHSDNKLFSDGNNTPEAAEQLYFDILHRIGYKNKSTRSGFGKLGIVYGFQHGTPNNSLPILWWSSPNKWQPLLKR
jgi:hypothetical protein